MKTYKEMCDRAYVLTWANNTIYRCATTSVYNHIYIYIYIAL